MITEKKNNNFWDINTSFIKYVLLSIFFFISLYICYFKKKYDEILINLPKQQNYLNYKSLEFYFSKYLCDLIVLKKSNCAEEIFTNYNFFYEIEYIKRDINIFVDLEKSFIENLFLIIGIIPFLKFNSTINYSINNKGSQKLYKIILNYKKKKDNIIPINIEDLPTFKKRFYRSINYIWEISLSKKILDIMRFIIDNYYGDNCYNIYEEALNKNYIYIIKNKINNLSNLVSEKLISK